MKLKNIKKNIAFLFIYIIVSKSLYAEHNLDFPDLSDPRTIDGVEEFIDMYDVFAKEFTKYYSHAVLLSTQLTLPVGESNLGSFPGLYLGFAGGAAFANSKKIRENTSEYIADESTPKSLPSIGLSINAGLGITPDWDVWISFFPAIRMNLGKVKGVQLNIGYGHVKIKTMYNIAEGSFLFPGAAIGGFVNYNRGSISAEVDEIKSTGYYYFSGSDQAVVQDFTYKLSTSANWEYYSFGPEIKGWYNMGIIFPYAGYGVSMQMGKLKIIPVAEGKINVVIPANPPLIPDNIIQESTGTFDLSKKASPSLIQHRLIFGIEIRMFPKPITPTPKVTAEIQFDLTNRISGLSAGAGVQF
ncbi:MAG: hypothetical protein OEZ22_00500 [Spirochaetia bacterium]|nr:hypothetical protein [Spirochaetia bacterium]